MNNHVIHPAGIQLEPLPDAALLTPGFQAVSERESRVNRWVEPQCDAIGIRRDRMRGNRTFGPARICQVTLFVVYRKEKERLEVLAAKAEFEGRQEVDRAAAVLASEEALFLEEVEDLPNKGDHAHEDQKLGILSVVEVMWGRVFRMGL